MGCHLESRLAWVLSPRGAAVGTAAGREVERARKHRVVDPIAAIENAPADLDLPHSTGLRVLFNQLLVIDDEERQVENPVAPREANLRGFRSGISRNARQSESAQHNQARQAWRHSSDP